MRVYLRSLGCKLNRSELESWERELRALGHELVSSPGKADICVVNTCTVTHIASHKSRQLIRRLHRSNPSARLVVTGCYAEMDPEKIARIEGVSLVLGNEEKSRLVAKLTGLKPGHPQSLPPTPGRTRAFVKVQDGCDNHCTYCVIRLARGRERSRPLREVVEEIKALVAVGYKEVVLTGVHLGGYGREWDISLYELVKALLEETDLPRLRLSSIEPWDLRPEFFTLWEDSRLCRHLHLPLQSGCDATLKRMGRRYTTSQYAALIEEARSRIPDLAVTTDVMVGFPGETEEEFQESLKFVEAMEFARIHVFPYSPRPGTPAARMQNQVPPETKKERERLMMEVGRKSSEAFRRRFLNRVVEVLWEKPSQNEGGFLCKGLTDNYIRVFTKSPCPLSNLITPVRITALEGEGVAGCFPFLGDGGVETFLLSFQKGDVPQAHSQDEVDGLLQSFRQRVGIAGHLLELAGVLRRVREAALALEIDELYQFLEGDGGNFLDGGELLEDGTADGSEDVGEGFDGGVFTGLEVEDREAVSFLAGQVVDQVEAIAGEEAQGVETLFIVEGRGQVPAQAEAVGDDESIDEVGVVQVN